MRRVNWVCSGIAAVLALGGASDVGAQSASATLKITATVKKNCVVSTTALNFGPYRPILENRNAPLDGTATITVTCTKGATAQIEMDDGTNSPGRPRRMRLSDRDYLEYDIYKDSARTSVWGAGIFNRLDIGAAPSRNPRTFTAYGRVPGGQDAVVGSYTDTVVVTVLF